jgi:2'-5' RNA ligase
MTENVSRPPSHFRLFIGIEAPADVKSRLADAQQKLAGLVAPNAVRWVRPEQLHITLRFMGNVDVLKVEELKYLFQQACTSFAALALRAEGIGFFPRPRSPRVIWAGVQGDVSPLTELQQAIEAAVAPFSAEPADDRFHAHLTLGRIKNIGRQDADALLAAAQKMSKQVFGQWVAGDVQLIRSELSPKGARYTAIQHVALAQP